VLFPYARRVVAAHVGEQWGTPELMADIDALRTHAAASHAVDGTPLIAAADDEADAVRASVVANVEWQMDRDRKTGALKQLQVRECAREAWMGGWRGRGREEKKGVVKGTKVGISGFRDFRDVVRKHVVCPRSKRIDRVCYGQSCMDGPCVSCRTHARCDGM
jgi:hypothetical protein